jgi:hypothetical protein
MSEGSEPLPKMDNRSAGPKGAGTYSYTSSKIQAEKYRKTFLVFRTNFDFILGDKPYAMPPPEQDGPPPGGYGPVRIQ